MIFKYDPACDRHTVELVFKIDDETQKILEAWYIEGDHPDNNGVNRLLRQFEDEMPWCDHAKDLTNGYDEVLSQFRVALDVNWQSPREISDVADSFGKWFLRELRMKRDAVRASEKEKA